MLFSGKEEHVLRFHVHDVTFNAVRGCDKNISKGLGNKTNNSSPSQKKTKPKKCPPKKTNQKPKEKDSPGKRHNG